MSNLYISIMMIIAITFPEIGTLSMRYIVFGLMDINFRGYGREIYQLSQMAIVYSVSFLIALLFIKRTDLQKRIPEHTTLSLMLVVSTIFIVFPQLAKIIVPKSEFVSYSAILVKFAEIFLYISAIEFYLKLKPKIGERI